MEWKIITTDPDYYISDTGLIKNNKSKKLLKGSCTNKGYIRTTLPSGPQYNHRLVAIHFINNPQNLPEVNHKDGNKLFNNKSNLEWCNSEYNKQHAIKNEMYGNCIKVIGTCLNTGKKLYFHSISQTQQKGFDFRRVSECINNKRKSHKNYKWTKQ